MAHRCRAGSQPADQLVLCPEPRLSRLDATCFARLFSSCRLGVLRLDNEGSLECGVFSQLPSAARGGGGGVSPCGGGLTSCTAEEGQTCSGRARLAAAAAATGRPYSRGRWGTAGSNRRELTGWGTAGSDRGEVAGSSPSPRGHAGAGGGARAAAVPRRAAAR